MGGRPIINRHGRLLFKERGVSLPLWATFRLLASGKSSSGHVVLHHGALLQLMPNKVHMIGAGCFEKILKVIGGLRHLAFKITLGGDDELLVGVTSVLVVITLVPVSGYRDSLGPPLRPPIVASSAPLCTLVGRLGRCNTLIFIRI
jgi:hypothetical protein